MQTSVFWELFTEVFSVGCVMSLDEIYTALSPAFSSKYPKNKNIDAKIRQQLQVLRDVGYLTFLNNNGKYQRIE